MELLENITLTNSIEIETTPEKVFDFFRNIVDDESYQAWHPEDHVKFHWIRGEPFSEGSIAYAEEYIHGKLHKLKFLIKTIIPNRKIEFVPLSRLLRIWFPGNTFEIEPSAKGCVLTATTSLRIGRLARFFAQKKIDHGLHCVSLHMRQEGENLKRILESNPL